MAKSLGEMSLEELWQLFPIVLTEHDKDWANWFTDEHDLLTNILAEIEPSRISHVGSTAIDQIWAKPTVDILIEIQKNTELDQVNRILSNSGYICMSKSNTRLSLNKGYTENGYADRVFHIHVHFMGDNDELYFRDYLNANPNVAKEYENLKLKLWDEFKNDRDGYTDAKELFVSQYTSKAKAEYKDIY